MPGRSLLLAASALLLVSSASYAQNVAAPPAQPQSQSQSQSMQPGPGNGAGNGIGGASSSNAMIARPHLDPKVRQSIRDCAARQGVQWPPPMAMQPMNQQSQAQAMQPLPGNGAGNGAGSNAEQAHPRLTPEQREIVKNCFEENGVQPPAPGQHMRPMMQQGSSGTVPLPNGQQPAPGNAAPMPAPLPATNAPAAPPTGMPADMK